MPMDEGFVFLTVVAFLLVIFLSSVLLAIRGNEPAKYFLWAWAALMVVSLPFSTRANIISSLPAALMLLFFLYVIILGKMHSNEQLEVSHEETRRVLAESNRRIDEERRTISRTLHDVVNPNLLLSKNEIKRLQTKLAGSNETEHSLETVHGMIADAYTNIRDIIKNTRIELIDSIGFTAAVESLVSHYSNVLDKPLIVLDHDLPKRPNIDEDRAVAAFKIIREAVFNTVKHANATKITIKIRWNERQESVYVEVRDDGIGLPPPGKVSVGIGLIDMRERARAIGSVLRLGPVDRKSNTRPGTKLSFSFLAQSS